MDKKELAEKLSDLLSARIDWKKLTRDELDILHSAFNPVGPLLTAFLEKMDTDEREEIIKPFVAGPPSDTQATPGRKSLFARDGGGIIDRLNAAKQRPVIGPILDYIGL